MFGKPKPDNNTKSIIEPYVKTFYQHYVNIGQFIAEMPDINTDDVINAELYGSEILNEKRKSYRNLYYKANEEIQLARKCTKNIESGWSKGKYLTDKMYSMLSDLETLAHNSLKLDGFWDTSEEISAEKLAKLQKPYILENRKLGKRSDMLIVEFSEEWMKIFPDLSEDLESLQN